MGTIQSWLDDVIRQLSSIPAVILAAVIVALLVVLIAWLLWQRRRSRRNASFVTGLLEGTSDGVLVVDRKGRVLRCNSVGMRLLRARAGELQGVSVRDLFGDQFAHEKIRQWQKQRSGPHNMPLPYQPPPPGNAVELRVSWKPVFARRRLLVHLCLLRADDASFPGKMQNGVAKAGPSRLPRHTGFMQRLERAVIRMHENNAIYSVYVLNIDRFQQVNNHLGPALADKALDDIAARLKTIVSGNYLARLEGDYFGVLVAGPTGGGNAGEAFARTLQDAVSRRLKIHGQDLSLTASVGVVANASGYQTGADLLRDARIALSHARKQGRGGCAFFRDGMAASAVKDARIESDLRRAAENGEVRAVYQPIVDAKAGRVLGFETLARWHHPKHGEISPGEFIDIAENSEHIIAIGRHLRTVSCRRLVGWQKQANDTGLYLSFNLTEQEMRQPMLPDDLTGCLRQTGLSPDCVRIELVERMLLEHGSDAALAKIVALGLPIYIDDFGTGYSSFSRLYDSPVHTIKIDRSFVQAMGKSDQGVKVVSAIAGLGHSLGLHLVAEGVETIDELKQLQKFGCHAIQGYFFSPPVEAYAVAELLADQRWIGERLGQ